MIKTDGGRIYVTCGEACRIIRINNGRAESVCFGKRVEPEDDVAALGGGFADELSPDTNSVVSGKTELIDKLAVTRVETVDKSELACALPTLRGGETVRIALEAQGELRAELFYTPYIRGGMTRRAVFTNIGNKPLKVRRICAGGVDLALGQSVYGGDMSPVTGVYRPSRGIEGLTVAEKPDGRRGEHIGLYMLYGGRYSAAVGERRVDIGLDFAPFGTGARSGGAYELAPGESISSPELLAVYSDNGAGGLTRAVHDILRENLLSENAPKKPVALEFPTVCADEKRVCDAARNAGRLGIDAFTLPLASVDGKTVKLVEAAAAACAEVGIKLGVRFAPSGTDALYGEVKTLYDAGARHFVLDVHRDVSDEACTASGYKDAVAMYALLARAAADFADATAETAADDLGALRYVPCCSTDAADIGEACRVRLGVGSVVPMCALGGRADGGQPLKTAFDVCSLGVLAYRVDPAKLGEGGGRALRAQVFSYQDDRELIERGDLYRLTDGDGYAAAAVSKDKSRALAVYIGTGKAARIRLFGTDEHALYHVRELDKTFSGAALVGYGIDVSDVREGESVSFHLRQVADYEL